MRTMFSDECDLAACIAKRDQILPEQLHANRSAIASRQILGRYCWDPIPPEQFTHGSARTGLRQKFVLFTLHYGRYFRREVHVLTSARDRRSFSS